MGNRGPKSADSLTIVKSGSVVALHRPSPPDDLTSEQADEWRSIVGRMPADWFPRETHGLLVQYCRHRIASRRISSLVADCEDAVTLDVELYDRLLKMQERESRAMASLATRMRISQQSLYDQKKTKGKIIQDPWSGDNSVD